MVGIKPQGGNDEDKQIKAHGMWDEKKSDQHVWGVRVWVHATNVKDTNENKGKTEGAMNCVLKLQAEDNELWSFNQLANNHEQWWEARSKGHRKSQLENETKEENK